MSNPLNKNCISNSTCFSLLKKPTQLPFLEEYPSESNKPDKNAETTDFGDFSIYSGTCTFLIRLPLEFERNNYKALKISIDPFLDTRNSIPPFNFPISILLQPPKLRLKKDSAHCIELLSYLSNTSPIAPLGP